MSNACVILLFGRTACMWAAESRKPPAKPWSPRAPNDRACGGLPLAWMPFLPCAPLFSTRTLIAAGKPLARSLECLQLFPTPKELGCMKDSAGKFCPDIMTQRALANVQKETEDACAEARVPAGCVAASDGCEPS